MGGWGEYKDQTGWGGVQGPDWLRGEYKDQIGGGGGGSTKTGLVGGGGGEYKDQIGWGVPVGYLVSTRTRLVGGYLGGTW